MTIQITLVLSILTIAVVLFVTERLRVDVTALLILGALALTGLVTPDEALSGFSSPAVITVWAVFILSGGLARIGVANWIGRQLLRLAGGGEAQLVALIMLVSGLLSAFMNNVGVAALLLPVVMDIARQTKHPPSRLLIPLAFGTLMGGMVTMIGTPANILISDALVNAGLDGFSLFSFTPVGGIVLLVGTAFMVLAGRHLLPKRDLAREYSSPKDGVFNLFHLDTNLFLLCVPTDSPLAGKTLLQCRLGSALGLNVIAILQEDYVRRFPVAETVIQGGDHLLVEGSLDRLGDLAAWQGLYVEEDKLALNRLTSDAIDLVEVRLDSSAPLVGQTLFQFNFRALCEVNVLAVRRDRQIFRSCLSQIQFQAGDVLLLMGALGRIKELCENSGMGALRSIAIQELADVYSLGGWLVTLTLPQDTPFAGRTLEQNRLGDALDLTVLGIVRQGVIDLVSSPDLVLQAGDTLLVQGDPEALSILKGLQNLQIEHKPQVLPSLESERVGLMEVVLSPHTTLAGKTLRDIRFREKHGLSVLGIWRGGEVISTTLRDIALRFGDALLLYGPRSLLSHLAAEPDFLVLTEAAQAPPRRNKAPVGILIMVSVLVSVIVGWLPLSIATVIGATMMVVVGCLTMEEAYRTIDWKSVFLIAGMLPLGIAMQKTGAAQYLSEAAFSVVSSWGGLGVIAGLFVFTTLISQVMPNAAVAVLLAPVALSSAEKLGISPYALMMVVALATPASFFSPISHPANLLVLGPGGYRFNDYIKVGLPLTLVTLVVVLVVLPVFWPL